MASHTAFIPHKGVSGANRRERRRAETRERLFRAALDLFARRGFLETTVEDITEAADVGKGTFFNYFLTKEHVLATFGAQRLAAIEHGLERARKGPVLPVLRGLATDLAGQANESPALLRAIYAAHASCAPVRA
jgi:AcrR family transcriptional regulator